MTDFLERKATVGALPDEEEMINNVAWAIYGGKLMYCFDFKRFDVISSSRFGHSQFPLCSVERSLILQQTISATESFLHLMATHLEVQRTAQKEIDRVVGNDRLPDFSDRASLPYIEAVYHEVLRHSPPLPLGIAHSLMEDDVYEGYFLPRGNSPIFRCLV